MMTLLLKVRQNGWLMQKRWTELGKAEKLLLEEDVALVPLYQSAKSYVMKPNVKGIVKHNISPEYSFKWAYIEEK